MKKTYIGISRDHSVSMRSLTKAAAKDYNETISSIAAEAAAVSQDTIVSVVECGQTTKRVVVNSSVNALKPLNEGEYLAYAGSTALFDSIGDLITQLEATPDANDPDVTFLVMAITDGEENSSRNWPAYRLMDKIQQLQRSDRWTFVFRVPRGYAASLARQGVPIGNILEWDQTDRGFAASTEATRSAFSDYYKGVSSGAMKSTTKFYANMADVSLKDVKKTLTDISPYVNLWYVDQKDSIRPFCERKSGKAFV